jgi:malonate-semialdehyde dehydrogenase (acetylating)/methylmalonate-semialdehyde dehydrogenase
MVIPVLANYVNGRWVTPNAAESLEVRNPATAEILARVPMSSAADVDEAVRSADRAFYGWRATPVIERAAYLFKLRQLLEDQFEEIARTITLEAGKTIGEARAELRRGIENVEVACGVPSLAMGYNVEDIASGIDEILIRQPLGVVAAIVPFNFPAMIPLWFMPYAIACGNCFVLKPSERVPLTMQKIFALVDRLGLPPGVASLVNGSAAAVDTLLDHPSIRAVSFVGSSPVARYVYERCAKAGKRVQCQGGAKNPVVIMPDADMETSLKVILDSAFGCAGQRCLAASVALPVGEARTTFTPMLLDAARSRKIGFGLDPDVELGPVITAQSRGRIANLVGLGVAEGGTLLVDGRDVVVSGYEKGNFIGATVLSLPDANGELGQTEIFGPVLSLTNTATIDEAIAVVNASAFGNMACLFTSSGAVARKFRYETRVGNVGINVGTPAPMAFFPFSGSKGSFFGDLHAQGRDAIDFYMDKKVVVERWPREWSRRF